MTDCTSPDWLQDAINAIQDLDTAQDLVDGVASLQQENERLREFVMHKIDCPIFVGSDNKLPCTCGLNALLAGGK